MNNPTPYICPKCNHALRFWFNMHDFDSPCRCECPHCKGGIGLGKKAKDTFENWEKKFGQKTTTGNP